MSRTASQVQTELLAISPEGWAIPCDPDTVYATFLSPIAAEWAAFEAAADEMAIETDPRAAQSLLPQFEQMLGPDPCGRDQMPLSFGQRQALAFQRYTSRGGSSAGFFIALAAAVGVAITVTESLNSVAGRMRAGQPVAPSPNQMVWIVHLPLAITTRFVAGAARAGESLGLIMSSLAECMIRRFSPAHTQVVFDYSGSTFGAAAWDGGATWDGGALWS